MGSHAQDQSTQAASSAAAQQVSQQQIANATQQQGNSTAAFKSLFGTPNASGKYTGGTESQFLDPNRLNQSGLQGAYKSTFSNVQNQNAEGARDSVQNVLQQANNRGQGAVPSGFGVDQQRQAYQTAAGNSGTAYAGLSMQQLQDAIAHYNQANGMLNNYGTSQGQLATSNNSGAAGTQTSLYGTASQQVQSPLGAIIGGVAGLGGAAISKYCWIAEAIYGADDPRTLVVRGYLTYRFRESLLGRAVMWAYGRFGERLAGHRNLCLTLKPLFDRALEAALRNPNCEVA